MLGSRFDKEFYYKSGLRLGHPVHVLVQPLDFEVVHLVLRPEAGAEHAEFAAARQLQHVTRQLDVALLPAGRVAESDWDTRSSVPVFECHARHLVCSECPLQLCAISF